MSSPDEAQQPLPMIVSTSCPNYTKPFVSGTAYFLDAISFLLFRTCCMITNKAYVQKNKFITILIVTIIIAIRPSRLIL